MSQWLFYRQHRRWYCCSCIWPWKPYLLYVHPMLVALYSLDLAQFNLCTQFSASVPNGVCVWGGVGTNYMRRNFTCNPGYTRDNGDADLRTFTLNDYSSYTDGCPGMLSFSGWFDLIFCQGLMTCVQNFHHLLPVLLVLMVFPALVTEPSLVQTMGIRLITLLLEKSKNIFKLLLL